MKKIHLLILFTYSLLTIAFTWPTAAHSMTAIPGDGFDGWQNYWNLWWIKEALLVKQTHFFFTDSLYPPTGVSLLFHTLNYFNGLWSLPFQLTLGLTPTYNLVVLFHFVMAGYGVYLLALYTLSQLRIVQNISQQYTAAFTAGFIFTFSPFHMAHLLGHMQVFSLTWIPFYILWLWRLLNTWRLSMVAGTKHLSDNQIVFSNSLSETKSHRGTFKRDLSMATLSLILVTSIDWYHTLYMLLFSALALLWVVWQVWWSGYLRLWPLLQLSFGLSLMGLFFSLLFSPLIIPMVQEARTADYMRPNFAESVILSADLLAFFVPSELHPVWGRSTLGLYENFTTTTSERLVFAGITPLILGGIAYWLYRHKPWVQFWGLSTLSFFLLALGPYLHIQGHIIRWNETPIPMPYLLLYKAIPFINITRSLSRYDLLVMLNLGILVTIAMTRLRIWGQLSLLMLIAFEFLAVPYPISQVDTPPFFQNLATDPDPYTIAYLPMNWDRPVPLLYQTTHRHKLLTAYTSRNNPLDLSWRTPVLQQWRTLQDDIIKTDLAALAPTILHDFQVRYIVLDYYQMPPGSERTGTERWVAAALPNQPAIYQDERLTVYQAPAMKVRHPYLQLGQGWGQLQFIKEQPYRVFNEQASIEVVGLKQAMYLDIAGNGYANLASLRILTGDNILLTPFIKEDHRLRIELPNTTKKVVLQSKEAIVIRELRLYVPEF